MAQPRRRAEFFCRPDGAVVLKAPPLKRSHAKRIYERDGGICQWCHREVKFGGIDAHPFMLVASGQVDHILARSRGGQNDDTNLRLLCLTCNSRKGAK